MNPIWYTRGMIIIYGGLYALLVLIMSILAIILILKFKKREEVKK